MMLIDAYILRDATPFLRCFNFGGSYMPYPNFHSHFRQPSLVLDGCKNAEILFRRQIASRPSPRDVTWHTKKLHKLLNPSFPRRRESSNK